MTGGELVGLVFVGLIGCVAAIVGMWEVKR
jgi:hypothetical protein